MDLRKLESSKWRLNRARGTTVLILAALIILSAVAIRTTRINPEKVCTELPETIEINNVTYYRSTEGLDTVYDSFIKKIVGGFNED